MANWKRSSGAAVTTEREVRVYNPETGEEGYVSVSWEIGRDRSPKIYGPVVRLDRVFDAHGAEIEEPRRTVLDAAPTIS